MLALLDVSISNATMLSQHLFNTPVESSPSLNHATTGSPSPHSPSLNHLSPETSQSCQTPHAVHTQQSVPMTGRPRGDPSHSTHHHALDVLIPSHSPTSHHQPTSRRRREHHRRLHPQHPPLQRLDPHVMMNPYIHLIPTPHHHSAAYLQFPPSYWQYLPFPLQLSNQHDIIFNTPCIICPWQV